jgi:hypothetical protein
LVFLLNPSPTLSHATRRSYFAKDNMTGSVRQQGLQKLVVFGLVSAAVFYSVYMLTSSGHHVFAVEALAVPGAFALAGAVQAITGIRFTEWSARWNLLAGWQRGVIGILIALVAFAMMMTTMIAFAALSGWI